MPHIYVDADACPVVNQILKVIVGYVAILIFCIRVEYMVLLLA